MQQQELDCRFLCGLLQQGTLPQAPRRPPYRSESVLTASGVAGSFPNTVLLAGTMHKQTWRQCDRFTIAGWLCHLFM